MKRSSAGIAFDPSRLTNASAAADSSSSDSEENSRKRRRLRGSNKEKAALGIFGSDSDDDGPGQSWKRKSLRLKGVDFMAAAVTSTGASEDEDDSGHDKPGLRSQTIKLVGEKDKLYQDNNHESEDEDEDEDEGEDGGVGLGFRVKAQGLGWPASADKPTEDNSQILPPRATITKTVFDGTSVLGRGFVPSSASMPTLKEADADTASVPRNKPQPSAFRAKGDINARSFGARIMANMGYVKGKGLGKEGQGRNTVIEANLRPQGVGLGAVKEKMQQERQEEKRQARLQNKEVIDSDEEEENTRRKARNKAFGSVASKTPRRPKTKHLTTEQFKAAAPGLHIPDALAKILDMTGPERKTLISASGIMASSPSLAEPSELVEARKLVVRAQAESQARAEEWQDLQDRKKSLDRALNELREQLGDAQVAQSRLQTFVTLAVDNLAPASDWMQVVGCFEKAIDLGLVTTETEDLAVAAIHPFLNDPEWNPLAEPEKYASELRHLSQLFPDWVGDNKGRYSEEWNSTAAQNGGIYRRHRKAASPYETMMHQRWLRRVRSAVRDWDALRPDAMLDVVESWKDLLPPFVHAQLMDDIAKKLETALVEWNPRKRRQSHQLPHTWLFPWLQHLPIYHRDPKGTGLVADARRKLKLLVDTWQFEQGVIPGLKLWKDAVGEQQWTSLIMSHVLPSMGKSLRHNFPGVLEDPKSYFEVLRGILGWREVLGDAILGEVVIGNVFPAWQAQLELWLSFEDVRLDHVAQWYMSWREVLKELAETDKVARELDKGLQMMNRF